MENKRRILNRNKTIAVSMMVAAAILFVIARLHHAAGYWGWLSAFAEAAMVGALADWFAVVALFRYPLGVPIPHTAIIPNKKNAIADSLAEFIQDKFLATEALVAKLHELNPAERLCSYLSTEKNAAGVALGITRVLADSLHFIDDDRVRKIVQAAINNRAEKIDLAGSAASLLDLLRKDNRHQTVLDEVLKRIGAWLEIPESQAKIAGAIDRWCTTEYPLLSRMIPNREVFMQGAGEKIANKLNAFLQDVNNDPDHEIRNSFDDTITGFIDRLRQDPQLRERVESIKHELLDNPAVSDYMNNLWLDLKTWLRDDLVNEHSKTREKLSGMAIGLGRTIARSSDLKDSINEHLEKIVRTYADGLRTGFAKHVSGTIREWKDEDFVREIELSIGSDLQFIRMNGTLVGGMIGLVIHAVSLLFA